jgi:hypothetical protein
MAVAVAVCAARFGRRGSPSDASRGPTEIHPLLAACSDLKCSEAIGIACLRALPAVEASREILLSLIVRRAALQIHDFTTSSRVRRLLRAQSQRDFRDGAVRIVDGWIFSLTETRVYALTALLAQDARPVFPEPDVSPKL